MNYGETLAYWYLRLNGFFVLQDFVLHQVNEQKNNADVDIIAIRFPYVHEWYGWGTTLYENENWDDDWARQFEFSWKEDLNIHEEMTGLIVEVKTNDDSPVLFKDNASSRLRMIRALLRMGMFEDRGDINLLEGKLLNAKTVLFKQRYRVGKLLVSASGNPKGLWLNLSLIEIEQFIKDRMRKYKHIKMPSRMFFHDDLIQYFAWQAGLNEME